MEKLDNSQRQLIQLLQAKVNAYQSDPELCASLTLEQYTVLAELQTIYNALEGKTVSNVPSLYNSGCAGVRNQMEQFTRIYAAADAKSLYESYTKKHREAKGGGYNLLALSDLVEGVNQK